MTVYRIVKTEKRARDLSGTGAYKFGGRWNSPGTYMLYTSENSSLALLETLVHVDESILPSDLFIVEILVKDESLICRIPDKGYPENWQKLDNLQNKQVGNLWMQEQKHLGYKVKSAVNPSEFNVLLNPLFTNYRSLVSIVSIVPLNLDIRLV